VALLVAALTVAPGPAFSALPLVGANYAEQPQGTSPATVTAPSGIASGDLLVAELSADTPIAWSAIGWTVVDTEQSSKTTHTIMYRVAGSAEPSRYSFSYTGSSNANTAAAVIAFRNVDTTTGLVNAVGGQATPGTTNTVTAPSITTTTASTLLVGFYVVPASGVNLTLPVGLTTAYNNQGASNVESAAGYKVLSAAGATGAFSATLDTSITGTGGTLVAFKYLSATTASLSAATLSFANQPVGTTSSAQTVTVKNTGASPLVISAVTVTGTGAASFTSTNTCGATVTAGGTCTVTVSYTPTASGSASASVSIASNASSSLSIALTGNGAAALALWHLDEASWSGTAGEILDSSGNGNAGVSMHGATTASATPAISGASGTCNYASFNGSTQYAQFTGPHVTNPFTVTAWIRPTSVTGAGHRIWYDDDKFNGTALSFGDPGNGRVRFYARVPATVYPDSAVTLSANTWYFIAGVMDATTAKAMTLYVFDASGNQLDAQSAAITSFTPSTGSVMSVGGSTDTSVEGSPTSFRFPGYIDEVATYSTALSASQLQTLARTVHSCAVVTPDHFAISHAASGVNCQAEPVTITAHTGTHASVATTATISVSTSTGHGDWTLTTGSGTFVAGAANSGAATYTYAAADNGAVVLSLRDTYAETVTIGVASGSVTQATGSAIAAEQASLPFAPSGFRITNGANAATTIATQQAGVTSSQSLALQAIRTDTSTGACTAAFASGATVNVPMAYQCNNPTTCVAGQTLGITNNGTTTSIAPNPNSAITTYTNVPLKFSTANAEAPFTLKYSDVGQITLAERYAIPLGSGAGSANVMSGSSQFVVQPYSFALSAIKCTTYGAGTCNTALGAPGNNPAASTAAGTVFLPAGQNFSATVTAVNQSGAATPNFGQETPPEGVKLTPTLVLPVSGTVTALNNPTAFGAFSAGVATGTTFNWPDVGIITLTPSVSDGNYLGSGNVTGTPSGNVGRFIPNSFSVAFNTPVIGTACTAGGYSYLGQPLVYTIAPVATVTALANGGATTRNYTGSLMRMTNSTLTGRSYTPTPAAPSLDTSGLPATSADPVIADLGSGTVSLTFGLGSGLKFSRSSVVAPFSANIALSINVIDADGVAAANPVTVGSGSGISFSSGATQRYGRLNLADALGSELLDLPMTLSTQYYLSSTTGFVANTGDSCTTAPALGFSNYQQHLVAGKTCVRDTGSPGVSGLGCAVAAGASQRYAPTAVSGAFNLNLAAPGTGFSGAVTVTATAPAWLQYTWISGAGYSSPTGMATFGIYPGPVSRVHQREVY